MLRIDHNVSRFQFQCANLDNEVFQVVSFEGTEEISTLFRYHLHLVSQDPDVDFSEVVNHPAKLIMARGQSDVPVSGVVTDLQQGGRTSDHFVYRAVLVPRLWLLTLNRNSRVFKNMKVDEIVAQVLEDAGFRSGVDYEFSITGLPTAREYCVQYQETDLNFISRLLEHEGICYYFQHDGTKDKVIFTDRGDTFPMLPDEHVMTYDQQASLAHEEEVVYEVSYRETAVTGNVLLAHYNPESPSSVQQGESSGDAPFGRHYEYGGNFPDGSEGSRLADVRRQEIEARRKLLEGSSNSPALRAGYKFTLDKYYRQALNQDYLLVQVRHRGSQGGAMGLAGVEERRLTDGEEPVHESEFLATPADVPFRPPRRTNVPSVPGLITARIESAGQDTRYAYLDDHGRYHARLHLDLDNPYGQGNATRPLRMVQSYSGPDYGIHFGNHESTEMVLACVNGDIDQPVALGTVPNPNNQSPVIAANRMHNIIRTKAGNELRMDDTERETQVLLQSTDLHRFLLDDKEDRIVLETTNKHRFTFDDKNENIELKTKEGHFALMDDKNKKLTFQSKDGHRISVSDQDKLITMVDESGDNLFQIDIGNKQLTIKTAQGGIELLAPQGAIDLKAKTINTESTADTTIVAKGNLNAEAKVDFTAKGGKNYTAEAGMEYKQKGTNVKSEAAMQHNIKGMQVKSEGTAQNDVQGAMVSLKGSAMAQVQGAMVKIN